MSTIQKKKKITKLKAITALSGILLAGGAVGYALYRKNKLKKVEKMIESSGLKLDNLQYVGQGMMNGLYYSGYDRSKDKWYLLKYIANPTINKEITERTAVLYKIFKYTNLEKIKSCSNTLILPVDKIEYENETYIVYEPGHEKIKYSLFGRISDSSIYGRNDPPSNKDIKLIYTLCVSVYCLHSWGVAHRAINPTSFVFNVLNDVFLMPSLETCNSTFLGYCHNPDISLQTEMVLFTPPEILVKMKNSSFNTTFNEAKKMDVWGLGVTIYLYLFRYFPYNFLKVTYFDWQNMYSNNKEQRDESSEKIVKYLNELKSLNKDIRLFRQIPDLRYPEFHDLLQGMLELNPKKRFSMDEVMKRIASPKFNNSFKDTLKLLEKNKLFN